MLNVFDGCDGIFPELAQDKPDMKIITKQVGMDVMTLPLLAVEKPIAYKRTGHEPLRVYGGKDGEYILQPGQILTLHPDGNVVISKTGEKL